LSGRKEKGRAYPEGEDGIQPGQRKSEGKGGDLKRTPCRDMGRKFGRKSGGRTQKREVRHELRTQSRGMGLKEMSELDSP